MTPYNDLNLPESLNECIEFHGHLCPGLVYGYKVAESAISRLGLERSPDEEVVAVCENDSCAIDAFQVMLGTTAGKGNLIINNYGKNVYTIFSRKTRKAIRFSRIFSYRYSGRFADEFERLEAAVAGKKATPEEMKRQKALKAEDLALKPIDEVFTVIDIDYQEPPYAPLAPSKACGACGELTMQTRMVQKKPDEWLCIPCSEK